MSRHQKPRYSTDYSKCCPICLAEVKSVREKRLPCQHILHKKCFDLLQLKGHWKCPTCRRPFAERRKTCSYEIKSDDAEGWGNHRLPYWDHLRFLPPLTPPGSNRSPRSDRPFHRGRVVDSPRQRTSMSNDRVQERTARRHREQEKTSSRRRSSVESSENRSRIYREGSILRERSNCESSVSRRRTHREHSDGRRTRHREYESKEESDEEFYDHVVENLADEPFFRFFSSNLVHEHEEREGTRRRSRRSSREPRGRSSQESDRVIEGSEEPLRWVFVMVKFGVVCLVCWNKLKGVMSP